MRSWQLRHSRQSQQFTEHCSNIQGSELHPHVLDNLSGILGTIYNAPVASANNWYLIDAPIPPSMGNIPLKRIDIGTGEGSKTIWFDDFKVTNVRLYAGKGVAQPANMSNIATSQLGFVPLMKKQFSSPVPFSSFELKRVSDNATVFTGGGVVRVDSDQVIDGTVWIGDFSGFTTPGRYKIVAGTKELYPFDIRSDVFDQACRAARRFFYYQRAFTPIEQQYAEGPWYPSFRREQSACRCCQGLARCR